MLQVELDQDRKLAVLRPDGALTKGDFEAAASQIDPFIAQVGTLNGLVVCVETFPGWDSFAALSTHLKFVRDHHRKVRRVAIVTDSRLGDFAESVASHFVAAEIRHFPYGSLAEAQEWVGGAS